MSLKGSIETFYLSSILQLLSGDKKTGVLTISEGNRRVQVFIKNGNIIYATGAQKEVRLGYLLRTKGIISAEELQGALSLAKQRNERLGKILVEKGYISTETLRKFIHQQVREVLYDLFLWKRGDFEYLDQELHLDDEFTNEINHMEIILEGSRRVDEWSVLRKRIPYPQIVFRISKNVEQQDSINLNANEWRIISLVDGKRTVHQIVADSGHEEYTVYRILNSLISSGLIERVEVKTSQGAPETESTAIVQTYHEILQGMRQLLEKAAGEKALSIMEQAKAGGPAQQQRWVQGYDFARDMQSNNQQVLHGGAWSPSRKEELFVGFNALILAILRREMEVLNAEAASSSLQEFMNLLDQWQKRSGKTEIQKTVLTSINQTIQQFKQEVARAEGSKDKSGGLLSFLKRK